MFSGQGSIVLGLLVVTVGLSTALHQFNVSLQSDLGTEAYMSELFVEPPTDICLQILDSTSFTLVTLTELNIFAMQMNCKLP